MKFWCGILLALAISPAWGGDMVHISAGAFTMGCTETAATCEDDEGMPGGMRVYVPAFDIDLTEVTVAEYRACVRAGKCKTPIRNSPDNFCNYAAPGRDSYPVNCVDWTEASQYCRQQGKRLPLEAEWEKAARAGSLQAYVWGKAPDCRLAILNDGKTRGSARNEMDGCGEDRSWAVASRAPNAYGLYDMFGNVSEWVENWHDPYALRKYAAGDLHWPPHGEKKVIRGGAWDEKQEALRNASRYAKPPNKGKSLWGSNGFRCVKDAKPDAREGGA